MLVLARKRGDKIIINENIEITVTNIRNGCVRIGIEAPRDINIRRAELPGSNSYANRCRHDKPSSRGESLLVAR